MRSFQPDLIIEITSACNRSCSGCYAPNVVSNKSAEELIKKEPSLFLDVRTLENEIIFWEQRLPEVISVRGGEPSLHPDLPAILKLLKYFGKQVVLETHGRWLLPENRETYSSLIQAAVENSITIKISFDSMHGLKAEQLKLMTSFLETQSLDFLIAITEKTVQDFSETKALATWIEDSKFIYQEKATSVNELIKPVLGVLGVSGKLNGELKSKFSPGFDLKEAVG